MSGTSAFPGSFPTRVAFSRRCTAAALWTMRMFAGFGTPRQTNERFRYLLDQGQTGLSTAFDFPTLMGYDSDSPRSLGEVGMVGVAVDTLRDMEILFDQIPLDKVTTSMTINGPAAVCSASTSRWPTSGASHATRSAGPSRTIASRSSSPSTPGSCRRGRRCGSSPIRSSSARRRCHAGTASASAAITSVRPVRRPRKSWRLRLPTASSM